MTRYSYVPLNRRSLIDDVVKAEKKIEKKARETKAKEKVKVEKKRAAAAFRVEKKVKRNVSALKKKTVSKKTDVVIQSPMGGEISPEAILEKTGPVDKIYIRVDENKAYWVNGDETGSVDLW